MLPRQWMLYKVILPHYLMFLCSNQTGLSTVIMSSELCPFIVTSNYEIVGKKGKENEWADIFSLLKFRRGNMLGRNQGFTSQMAYKVVKFWGEP